LLTAAEQPMTINRSRRRALPINSIKERQASLPEPLLELHRRLLDGFLTHAGPPEPDAVAGMATELNLDPHQALGALAGADLVHTNPVSGTISVAYPYSGRATPHRVQLDDGIVVRAMCALDALGIPQMTRRDARIGSTDPASGQPITVEVQGGTWRFEPAATVVLVATAAGGSCGSVADCCCPHINFHTDPQQAMAYLQAHPGMTGEVLGQAHAVETAKRDFGDLLDPHPHQGTDDEQGMKG
jgi:hypothetical protein